MEKRLQEIFKQREQELLKINVTLTSLIRINSIISSCFQMQEIMEGLVEEMKKLISFNRLVVTVYRGDQSEVLALFTDSENELKYGAKYPLKGTSAEWILKTGKNCIEDDLKEKGKFTDDEILAKSGLRSAIRVPIFSKGKIIGTFVLNSKQPGLYSNEDLLLLRPIASQLAIAIENQNLYQELLEKEKQARALFEVTAAINSSLNFDRLLKVLVEKTVRVLGVPYCMVGLLDKKNQALNMISGYGVSEEVLKKLVFANHECLSGKVLKERKPACVLDICEQANPKFPGIARELGMKSFLCVPIILNNEPLGVLEVVTTEVHQFNANEIYLLESFASQAAIAIEKSRQYQQLKEAKERIEELSQKDYLTGLFNRQFLDKLLKNEIARAKRYDRPLSVAMLDLDDFKHINDTYGHLVGDAALSKIGEIIRDNIRETDIAGRYGGDELLIILPETNLDDAQNVLKRINLAVEELNRGQIFPFALFFSMGIASGERDFEHLVVKADNEMYRRKRLKKRSKAWQHRKRKDRLQW